MRQSLSLSRGLSSWTTWTTALFAFFFIFSALWVAEFFALPFRRAQDRGRELAGAIIPEHSLPSVCSASFKAIPGNEVKVSREADCVLVSANAFLDGFRLRHSRPSEKYSFVDTSAFVVTNQAEFNQLR